jgi:hypothetical protein
MPVPKDIEQRQQRGYDTKTDTVTKTTSVRPSKINIFPTYRQDLPLYQDSSTSF